MKKIIYLFVAIVTVSAMSFLQVSAHTEDEPLVRDLIAGQHKDVGEVQVWNDAENLYVKYLMDDVEGWCLTETHLHVATSSEGIPQKKGNPIPGKFDYKEEHDCVANYTYSVPLTWAPDAELYIATHAVVQKATFAPYYASGVVDYGQGTRKDGTDVRVERSVPEQGLAYETGKDEENFFSLGFDNGWIIMEFDCPIINGEGDDVRVIEDTWGSYPLEKAAVFASQDNITWISLGEADNTVPDPVYNIHTVASFDLGELEWAKYIKVVDMTDPSVHNGTADGYDLNAVESLQDCIDIQKETAWGRNKDDVKDFSGKNWATYFTYTIQEPTQEWTLFDTITVPSNGNPASSNVLESGVTYRLEASGTFTYNSAGDWADAEWYLKNGDVVKGDTEGSKPYVLDTSIDGYSMNRDWGDYNAEHIYTILLDGTGSTADFSIYDSYYGDNNGFITVEIYELN